MPEKDLRRRCYFTNKGIRFLLADQSVDESHARDPFTAVAEQG